MANTVQEYILKGSEYVPARSRFDFAPSKKLLWEDIPTELRVTEERIRSANGAKNPSWLKRHLRWYGCKVAIPFVEGLWMPCGYKPEVNGYCRRHQGRAEASS